MLDSAAPGADSRDMRRAASLVVLLCLTALAAGCARPLSQNEEAFASALFGPSLDTSRVRIAQGIGLTPAPGPPRAGYRFTRRTPPPDVCDRDVPSPRTGPPAAFVFFERLNYHPDYYAGDSMAGWPEKLRVPHVILLAHELTHVWQWQNRERTGYHPRKALAEGIYSYDPYFYRLDDDRPFLDYGFEEQGALVQDYVCYRLINPRDERYFKLRALLAPVFPLDAFDAALENGRP
ncbi:hypothetical protein [Anianabacter salinae]|uniref:hypothetical protein n=1 Tax=Anianabacter salinae TaxID=2851023 RepID=UPI00225E625A|nr:hypothetical protein [Anianabacter salinae]MBV0913942.1 hypothetical protein [Anianabacter salinae]